MEVQFDNTLSRVQSNIKTVNKYMAEKLCKVPAKSVVAVKGKDESSVVNHQSKVSVVAVTSCTHCLCLHLSVDSQRHYSSTAASNAASREHTSSDANSTDCPLEEHFTTEMHL